MSAELRWSDSDGVWRRFERAPIVPTDLGLSWTAGYTDNSDGTWTSATPTDNSDGTWSA